MKDQHYKWEIGALPPRVRFGGEQVNSILVQFMEQKIRQVAPTKTNSNDAAGLLGSHTAKLTHRNAFT